jgi:hypothetical protein
VAEPFDLDAVYAEERAEPFEFRWGGRQWELPHMEDADLEVVNEIQRKEEFGADDILNLFPRLLPQSQREAWGQVQKPTKALVRLFEQWLTHSGASAGESSGSGDSSSSTEPKSKQTSTGSTESGSPKRSSRRPRKTATPPVNS